MLSVARLDTYRKKLREALLKVEEYFPNARKLYRTLQTTKVDRGDWCVLLDLECFTYAVPFRAY